VKAVLTEPPETPEHHPAVETALFTDVSYTAVLWDGRSHTVHTLGPLSSAIWMTIDGAMSISAIAGELEELGLVEQTTGRPAVVSALVQFWSLGLLNGSPPAPMPASACAAG
jgi:hypothetical protein